MPLALPSFFTIDYFVRFASHHLLKSNPPVHSMKLNPYLTTPLTSMEVKKSIWLRLFFNLIHRNDPAITVFYVCTTIVSKTVYYLLRKERG